MREDLEVPAPLTEDEVKAIDQELVKMATQARRSR